MNDSVIVWQSSILKEGSKVVDAINKLNMGGTRLVLIVSESSKLLGTISDGDIRRAILRGFTLESDIGAILNRNPIVVGPEVSREDVISLMNLKKVQQIPVINFSNEVIGLHLWHSIYEITKKKNPFFIMAGGQGKRLKPQTNNIPKPMLRIGDRPLLEHIIRRAINEGFSEFVISIHHLGNIVEDYFGNGKNLGVNINYIREDKPLGTAGSLSLFEIGSELPLIVTNGDLFTNLKFCDLLDFHLEQQTKGTMVVRHHEWVNPYGVVEINQGEIVSYKEKPTFQCSINAGIYVIEPDTLKLIPKGNYYDMPDFFETLRINGQKISAYPIYEQWLDIGSPADFIRANEVLEHDL